jgi:hypothetical protein
MNATESGLDLETITPLHWVAVGLALISAVIHLVFGIELLLDGRNTQLAVSFVLAAGGFVGAVVLFLFDYHRKWLYLIGIPFTGFQIVYWANYIGFDKVLNPPTTYAKIDKPVQLLLIAVLIVLYLQER